MSASAIMMMIFAIVLLWGGVIAAIVKLRNHPEDPEPDELEQGPDPAHGSGGAHRAE